MKKTYERPIVEMVETQIEKGFATSDTYGIGQFEYDDFSGQDENSAW